MGIRVAGLPLLNRTLLTAYHAGIGRFTVVASGSQQAMLRDQLGGDARLEGRVRWLESTGDLAPLPAQCLVLSLSVILDSGALQRWLARVEDGGSVTAPDGLGPSPLAVAAALIPPCIEAALSGEPGLTAFLEKLNGDRRLVHIPWDGMRHLVRSPAEVAAIERAMLVALRSPEDGPIVDRYVNRGVSARLTRWVIPLRVTPNQVTCASLVTGLLGAWLLSREGGVPSLVGLALFQLSVILDHVDGEVARLKFQFSRLGKWLDNASDHVVDLAVIASLTWRVAGEGTAGYFMPLGLAAALGVTGSFLIVFWWSVSGVHRKVLATSPARLLARGLPDLANRDGFCLGLWATMLLDRPMLFLWTLALGANGYWVAWLLTYGLPRRAPVASAGSAE